MEHGAIPGLPRDLVAILATVGAEGPVAIPVSAVHHGGEGRLLLALARRRAAVERLRHDPRAGLSLNGPGFSLSVVGEARVAADPLPGAESMIAYAIHVHRSWDARGPATEIDAGIRWRWTDPEAAERHDTVLAALAALAPLIP